MGSTDMMDSSRLKIKWKVNEGDVEDTTELETQLILAIIVISIGSCLICLMICACRYKNSAILALNRVGDYRINADADYN